MRIACFGGAHWDTKAHLLAPPDLGGSNPARVTRSPGGVACNVARNLARLGAEVSLWSLTGDDDSARELGALLATEGIATGGLVAGEGAPTASYTAVLAPGGGLVLGIADMEVYDLIDSAWGERAAAGAGRADLWVIDANLPEEVIAALTAAAPVPVLADPVSPAKASRLRSSLGRLTFVFPEKAEAAVLAAGRTDDPEANADVIAAAGTNVVVTLGEAGALEHRDGSSRFVPAIAPERVVDVTGAGDALVAGYAYGMAAGSPDPLRWGLAAASVTLETAESVSSGISPEALRARARDDHQ